MNGAIVRREGTGLRVEIAPGHQWAIAAVPGVLLPSSVGQVRVQVRSVSGAGRWLMRLYGDLRGVGAPVTVSIIESSATVGSVTAEPDPRLFFLERRPPVQVQLGLEGQPGDSVIFDAVEFAPAAHADAGRDVSGQRRIPAVDLMPDLPHPFKMLAWHARALAFDHFAFDFHSKGQYLPLIWLDNAHVNQDGPAFGIPSYVGGPLGKDGSQEGITCMGAVLGAVVAGVDKRRQEYDYVAMCQAFFNRRNGLNLALNHQDDRTGGSAWYETWPSIVFYALADRSPGAGEMDAILKTTADRWCDASYSLSGAGGIPNFNHTAFDFARMQPVDNGKWREPDGAAGVAWLEYMAWRKFGSQKYLDAADSCLHFLQESKTNPYYEVLMPWGAITAARVNAEAGRHYDVDRFLNWCFGISDTRSGWGVTLGNWGGYDCSGLVGSVDNRGGYAFAMNTFTQAGALVPLARYDTHYARALGKWMLNLSNAARLFYPRELPPGHESSASWQGDPKHSIAYEGLRREWEGKSPYATGDPVTMKWGPKTDLGIYGSSYVGFLGGIVRKTNEEAILQLDCLATDFFHDRAYPTYLYYNPYPDARNVELDVGPRRKDLYDAATGRFLVKGARGHPKFILPGGTAVVLVIVPAGGKESRDGKKRLSDGIVIDYAADHD